jgi:2,4-dienoyl-CoA reductase-like NADH-dependent reductase (Old Yellow Enzyme family)
MTLLFSPLALRAITVKNRIVVSPMCQYSANEGMANDWHVVHLGQYATGGAGLIFTEAVAVEKRGRITLGDVGLWSDQHIEPLRRVADFIKSNGAVAAIQLGHSGRKGSTRPPWDGGNALAPEDAAHGMPPWETIAPSAIAYDTSGSLPRSLGIEEIAEVVRAWRDATRRAVEAGFDVVEVHAAHGYLIHQFLTATSNCRTDSYGGDLIGRIRFLTEIVEAVRSEWPQDKPVFVRLSVTDDADPQWSLDDTYAVVTALRQRGVDIIDCSSGGISKPGFAIRGRYIPGFQISLAHAVKYATGMACMAVGLITHGAQAEAILQQKQADLVAIGREALVYPHWALHAAHELGVDLQFQHWPKQYGWWLERRAHALLQASNEYVRS